MNRETKKFIGIDFSGNKSMWGPGVTKSNVWIAMVEEEGQSLTLKSVQRIQEFFGTYMGGLNNDARRPFASLVQWLAEKRDVAVAIDAPFSVPKFLFEYGAISKYTELLTAINKMRLENNQDFPSGQSFVNRVYPASQRKALKPLRLTESVWSREGVNTRSAVWAGIRPGAPFASACIKLLAKSGREIWPWAEPKDSPLVEAFPAGQLSHWKQPFTKYNGKDGGANRIAIIRYICDMKGLKIDGSQRAVLEGDADALDAVLCCYAARSVVQNKLGVPLPDDEAWRLEGWIAVHR